jgi:predicted ester cyclase
LATDQHGTKAVARRLAEQVFSQGDLDVFDEIFADTYVNHNIPVPGIPGTKDGFRELVKATRNAFPDLVVHVDDLVAEGTWSCSTITSRQRAPASSSASHPAVA